MPSQLPRKNINFPVELYQSIAEIANHYHTPFSQTAIMLLVEALDARKTQTKVPVFTSSARPAVHAAKKAANDR